MTVSSVPTSVSEWLNHLDSLHSQTIELGLGRVQQVKDAMQLTPTCPVFVVAGTNGKGSVCAFLSQMLAAAGYRVGTYTSPHLLTYHERVRINMQPVDDATLCRSFATVEHGRGDTPLTYFEFGTLAAVACFVEAQVDAIVLEVGLGGRLDAVNVFDADCAVITSIDLDHQDWLGDNRESIGFEKAGVMRPHRPAICIDPEPPASVLAHAAAIEAPLFLIGRDFGFTRTDGVQWQFQMGDIRRSALPMPALRGNYQLSNASAAIAALCSMANVLPVSMGAIRRGLVEVEWAGRFQVLPGRPVTVFDVGHNPHAARALASSLGQLGFAENRIAVFSALADKDIAGVIAPLRDQFDAWYIAPLDVPRAANLEQLQACLNEQGARGVQSFASIGEAWQAALSKAGENDRIVVFGSFYTVAAASALGRF